METLPLAIGRYLIRNFIARGGMGTVYLAVDPNLDRQVAIKLLREADNDDLRVRFTREARSAANLRHRNIVTIFDVGEHEHRPFIAMEYIHGQTLSQLLNSDAPISTVRKLQLIEDLCEGLSYAHARGVVHRDIKPANLMVDGDHVLKILDFGIARAMADVGMTQTGFLIGSLNYMSPEQIAGRHIDGRSDMFAVGAVLYEMLTRTQAFPGNLDNGLLNRILNQEPENFEKASAGLDPAIVTILRRSLDKDPNKRFADLRMMAADIANVRQRLDAAARSAADEPGSVIAEITPTMVRPPRRDTDREELARRRAMHIEERLTAARRALEALDYEAAVTSCEEALLIDPDEPRVGELLRRARRARDQQQADGLVREAQGLLRDGDLTKASNCVREALALVPESPAAVDLARVIGEARVERDRRRQRAEALVAILNRARAALDAGQFDGVMAAAAEALEAEPGNADALDLKRRAEAGIAERERKALDLKASRTADEARQLFAAGRHADALGLLEEFFPAHKIVSQLWMELSTEAERLARAQQATDDRAESVDAPDLGALAPLEVKIRPEDDQRTIVSEVARTPRSDVPAVPERRDAPQAPAPSSRRSASAPTPQPKSPASSRTPYYAAGLVALLVIGVTALTILKRGTGQDARPAQTQAAAPAAPVPEVAAPRASEAPAASVRESAPPPPAPAPENEPVDAQLARLRQMIRGYVNSANYRDALSPTMLALQLRPRDPDFIAASRQIEAAARRDSLRARDDVRSHASPPASNNYADANRLLDQAQRLGRSGRTEEAIRTYWKAQDLFKEAAVNAASTAPSNAGELKAPVATNPEPPAAPGPSSAVAAPPPLVERQAPAPTAPPVTTPSTAALPPATQAPVNAPVQPPAPAVVAPPQRINEEPAIRATLEAYAQGFRDLNADAVKRVFPNVDVAGLRRSFGEARQQEMQIENAQIRVEGTRATVTCQVRTRFTPRAGQPQGNVVPATFALEKTGGSWLIVSRR